MLGSCCLAIFICIRLNIVFGGVTTNIYWEDLLQKNKSYFALVFFYSCQKIYWQFIENHRELFKSLLQIDNINISKSMEVWLATEFFLKSSSAIFGREWETFICKRCRFFEIARTSGKFKKWRGNREKDMKLFFNTMKLIFFYFNQSDFNTFDTLLILNWQTKKFWLLFWAKTNYWRNTCEQNCIF